MNDPGAQLHSRPTTQMPLADFFQRAGREFFYDWDDTAIRRMNERRATKLAGPSPFFVLDRILEALSRVSILATVAFDPVEKSYAKAYAPDKLGRRWWEGPYYVSPGYWSVFGIAEIDLPKSSASMHIRNIHLKEWIGAMPMNHPIATINIALTSDKVFRSLRVSIENPEDAIKMVTSGIDSMPERLAKRYDKFRNELLQELLIVGWRYIAMERPELEQNCSAGIIKNMREYLEESNIFESSAAGLGERALTNIATKIVSQWRRQNKKEDALLNSTPNSRFEDLVSLRKFSRGG